MNKILPFLIAFLGFSVSVSAQLIYDFETPETSNTFQYFGSTLDGTPTMVIANPNPSGINTSDNVLEFVRAANSETFAGAFALEPRPLVDATNGGKLCIDVHMDHIGNVMLKLEQSTTGAPNWELIVENTLVNEWEQLCYSFALPGSNGAAPPTGNVWGQHVIFPDFGVVDDTDVVTYFDNFVQEEDDTVINPVDVTFSVDMSDYAEAFTTVYVLGSFNDFSADATPLTDQGNGIWATTLSLNPGAYDYKYQVDVGTDEEGLRPTDECVNIAFGANGEVFVNRSVVVTDGVELSVPCWGSCYSCADKTEVTFNLGVPNPDVGGVWLAGGPQFGPPGGFYQMSDEDGDGVFSITIERGPGYSTFYTFTNGACPDFSCKEDISGQDCANPDNFNDRFLDAGTTEVNTCFAECTTSTAGCEALPTAEVTFTVNVKDIQVAPEGMLLAGQFADNFQTDLQMTDNGDDTWSTTIALAKQPWEFKYKNGPDGWEPLDAGTECTVTTPDGAFTNRFIDLTDAADVVELTPYCFATCDICAVSVFDLDADHGALQVFPTSVTDVVNVAISRAYTTGTLTVYGTNGDQVHQSTISTDATMLNVTDYSAGMYIVTLSTEEFVATQRFVKL